MHTAEVIGPDVVPPLQVQTWRIQPSIRGTLFDIDYQYRRLPLESENEWISLDYTDARLFARAGDTALEFKATVKNFWTGEVATTFKSVTVERLPDIQYTNVFPNPANGVIAISLPENFPKEPRNITVYSATGDKVFKFSTTENTFTTIDLRNLSNGLYIIIISAAKQVLHSSVILQR